MRGLSGREGDLPIRRRNRGVGRDGGPAPDAGGWRWWSEATRDRRRARAGGAALVRVAATGRGAGKLQSGCRRPGG